MVPAFNTRRLAIFAVAACAGALFARARQRKRDRAALATMRVQMAADRNDLDKAWVQNVFLLVTAPLDYGYLAPTEARALLREGFAVYGVRAFERALTELARDRMCPTYGWVVHTVLARLGGGAQYISQAASWSCARSAVRPLRALHRDWSSLAAAYLTERAARARGRGAEHVTANVAELQAQRWRDVPFT